MATDVSWPSAGRDHGGVPVPGSGARSNILSAELITELTAAFDDLEQREDVSAVVLTGGGRAFCAGADLADLLAAADGDPIGVRRVCAGLDRVRRSSLVTIAAVNGPAVGAGLNLALVCDIHVAAASAWFDCRFAAIGLHPGRGNLRMLQQMVGPQVAALCRRRLDADEAQAAGLVLEATTDEDLLTAKLNGWIGGLFSPENRDDTVRALVESQGGAASTANEGARTRLKDAEEALRRLQAAIVAGLDPAAVKEAMNAAQAQREAARVALASAPLSGRLEAAEVYAMIDALGDVGDAIKDARPDSLTKLYKELGIKVSYRHEESGGEAVISLVVANVRVRGGTCALTTRLDLA